MLPPASLEIRRGVLGCELGGRIGIARYGQRLKQTRNRRSKHWSFAVLSALSHGYCLSAYPFCPAVFHELGVARLLRCRLRGILLDHLVVGAQQFGM